ncbi:MAG: ParA family protein [Bacillota bacterium]
MINFKGGVGKTTVATNLSAALSEKGRKVLLIDTDPQCNSTYSFIQLEPKPKWTLYDVLYGKASLKDIIINLSDNLGLVPSDRKLGEAANWLITQPAREFVLRKSIMQLRGQVNYDYIIIDNNPNFNVVTQNSLAAASELAIPVQLKDFSMQGIANMVTEIREFCDIINHPIHVSNVIPTMVDQRYSATNEYLGLLQKYFKGHVFHGVRTDENINKAQIAKMPVFELAPSSRASKDFWDLADVFIKQEEVAEYAN